MIALIGGNETAPTTPLECGYIVFLNIAAAIINSYIFGEMTFLTNIITKKQTEYQKKVDIANTAMKNIDL